MVTKSQFQFDTKVCMKTLVMAHNDTEYKGTWAHAILYHYIGVKNVQEYKP